MTATLNDPPLQLSTIESLKAYLAGLVRAAYDAQQDQAVLLTYVGGEFMKAFGVTFEKHLSALADQGKLSIPRARRKLAPFVEYYCEDILEVFQDPPGTHRITPRTAASGAKHRLQETIAESSAIRFHRSVWAAFIRPLDGKRRFINLDQIGFTDASEPPVLGEWREIPQKFVLGAAADARVNGIELEARIIEWAKEADIPLSKLVMPPSAAKQSLGKLATLMDMIEALPDDLARQWSIPASILNHLYSQR